MLGAVEGVLLEKGRENSGVFGGVLEQGAGRVGVVGAAGEDDCMTQDGLRRMLPSDAGEAELLLSSWRRHDRRLYLLAPWLGGMGPFSDCGLLFLFLFLPW